MLLQWIARWLLSWLEQALDPGLQARLSELDRKIKAANEAVAAAEEAEREGLRKIDASKAALASYETEQKELRAQIQVKDDEITALRQRRQEIANEAAKVKAELDHLVGGDRVRVDL